MVEKRCRVGSCVVYYIKGVQKQTQTAKTDCFYLRSNEVGIFSNNAFRNLSFLMASSCILFIVPNTFC